MVERVNHSAASSVATTGWETAKVGLAGWLAAGVIGALAVAAVAAVPVAVVGLIGGALGAIGSGGALAGLGAAFASTAGTLVMGGAATVGAVGGLSSPVGPIAGGLLGILKGTSRVNAEKAAFERRQEIMAGANMNRDQVVAQRAFAMGVQAGQQSVIQELQQYQETMIRSQMAQAQGQKPVVGQHTAAVTEKRMGAPAQQAQVG
ncbi:MAG: hypothetical protein LW823_07935 [Rickettsiales bacterium]|jgi:hypothetical protein|nr:hypothetical protein [Rickettsiales bacterium]